MVTDAESQKINLQMKTEILRNVNQEWNILSRHQ